MNLTWARLTLRLSRFELLAFGGFVSLFIALTVGAATWIDSLRPPLECLNFGSVGQTVGEIVTGCEAKNNAWYSAQNGPASLSVGLLIFLSFGISQPARAKRSIPPIAEPTATAK